MWALSQPGHQNFQVFSVAGAIFIVGSFRSGRR